MSRQKMLSKRRKTSFTSSWQGKKNCQECNIEFWATSGARRFCDGCVQMKTICPKCQNKKLIANIHCSVSCAAKGRTAWNKGTPMSENHKQKLSASLKGRMVWNKGITSDYMLGNTNTLGRIMSDDEKERHRVAAKKLWKNPEYRSKVLKRRFPTTLEHALSLLLQAADLNFEAEKSFDNYTVDAWVPSHKLVFEADGYHHINEKRQIYDRQRDTTLINDFDILAVIRLTASDLTPWTEV